MMYTRRIYLPEQFLERLDLVLAGQKYEDISRERLFLVDLQDGDQRGVKVVGLGLFRVHELHGVLPPLDVEHRAPVEVL